MDNREYLAKREEEYIKNRIKDDKVREKELEKLYKQAIKEVQNKIFEFYGRYFGNNSSSLEEVKKMISATEKEGLENIKNNISRLELLEYQLNTMLDDLTNKTKDFMLKEFQQAVIDEAERQTGAVALNKQDIDEIINSSFKAGDFSDNIWGNKEALLESIKQGLIRSFALGEHPDKVAMDVAKKMNSNLNSAKRIMRTEIGLVQIAQQKKNYEDYDVQYYQNIREPGACEHCKALAEDSVNIDSAPIFKVSEMQRGVNAPLFHPNCRCSTIPVTDEVVDNGLSQVSGALWKDCENATNPKEKEKLVLKMEEVAKKYYDSMRNSEKAPIIEAIAKSYSIYTGSNRKDSLNKATVALNHAVYEEHLLAKNDGKKYYGKFDPDYDMMQSFQRLRVGKPLKHDIIMVEHEALENYLMQNSPNMTYMEAHALAEKEFNYNKALNEWKEENL